MRGPSQALSTLRNEVLEPGRFPSIPAAIRRSRRVHRTPRRSKTSRSESELNPGSERMFRLTEKPRAYSDGTPICSGAGRINTGAGAGGATRSDEGWNGGENSETRIRSEIRTATVEIPAAIAVQNGLEIVEARGGWEKEPSYVPEAVKIAPAAIHQCVSIPRAQRDGGPRVRSPLPSQ